MVQNFHLYYKMHLVHKHPLLSHWS